MNDMISNMPVIILAGGDGINLGKNGENIPKPLVLINGKPLLGWLIDHYKKYGFKKIIICAGKGKVLIDSYINEYLSPSVAEIQVVDTGFNNRTGSRLAQVKKLVEGAPCIAMTYGDTFSDINLTDELTAHINSKKISTLLAVHNPTRFRILGLLDTDSLVHGFANKPVLERDYINGGFYFFNKDIFYLKSLSEESTCVLENEVLEEMVVKKELNAYRYNGYWQPIDNERDRMNLEKKLIG